METKSLALFVVGLLIGGGSGYFMAHYQLQSQYDQLQSQYDELESNFEELVEQYALVVASSERVTEVLVSQTLSVTRNGYSYTTLNVREQATVTGTYSMSPTTEGKGFVIQIFAPDLETVVFLESGSASGSFRFEADVSGSYRVQVYCWADCDVQIEAEQSYQ